MIIFANYETGKDSGSPLITVTAKFEVETFQEVRDLFDRLKKLEGL